MDKPIQVGDLVMVVRHNGCSNCPPKSVGKIFLVSELKTFSSTECAQCKQRLSVTPRIMALTDNRKQYEVSRLKRIPPLEELEGQRTEEELKLPTTAMREAAKRHQEIVKSR